MSGRQFWKIIALLSLVLALGLWIRWVQKTDALSRWQAGIIEAAISQIQGRLPFEIESVKVKKEWRELLSGRIASLEMVLRRGALRIFLRGPVDLAEQKLANETLMKVTYDPEVQAELGEGNRKRQAPPVQAHLNFEATRTFSELRSLELRTEPLKTWGLKPLGVQISRPLLMARWKDALIHLEISADSVEWSPPLSKSKTVLIGGLRLQAQTTAAELSNQLGLGRWTAQLAAKTGEVLWNDLYLDLPLQNLPLSLEVELGKRVGSLSLGVPTAPGQPVPLRLETEWDENLLLDWKLTSATLPLPPLLAGLKKVSPTLFAFEGWEFRSGAAQVVGSGIVQLPDAQGLLKTLRARLRLEDLSVRNAARGLALSRTNLGFISDLDSGIIQGELSIGDLRFKRLRGQLASTEFKATRKKEGQVYDIQFGQYLELPLRLEGIPLKMSSLQGRWLKNPSKAEDAPTKYQATGSLRLESTPLARILESFCVPTRYAPPAQVTAHFPKIEFTEESIDPTGQVRAELFDGFVEADELGLFDYLSPVPELDFSLRFKGIRLDLLGDWLQFGEMDGTLEGHALDVVFQSWLPTHYDARFEAKPRRHKDVVFSPDAMKNFARLAVSDGIDQLPGIVDWIAFGWPRRVLGGYDVDYVGIELLSDSGFIQVKTLDPPEIVAKERKHFVLYSDRFKMPLETARYPLIIHATAIGNYIRRMFLSFSPKEDLSKGQKSEKSSSELPPLPKECIPD